MKSNSDDYAHVWSPSFEGAPTVREVFDWVKEQGIPEDAEIIVTHAPSFYYQIEVRYKR